MPIIYLLYGLVSLDAYNLEVNKNEITTSLVQKYVN